MDQEVQNENHKIGIIIMMSFASGNIFMMLMMFASDGWRFTDRETTSMEMLFGAIAVALYTASLLIKSFFIK